MRSIKLWILALSLLVAAFGCNGGDSGGSNGSPDATNGKTGWANIDLTGAGSTFVNPAMSQWIYNYQQKNPGIQINYQPVGSGSGISQFKAGTVDFGASDVALTDAELKTMPGETVQIPVASGCVALAYNLPGIKSGLKLSGDVIADIYLGKITNWSDPRITQQNPALKLPDTAITVASRSDGSGTTYIFTDYLSSVSPAWKSGPGKGKTISWPVGVSGKGSAGVAGLIKQTPGCIGYVELAYVLQNNFDYAVVRNRSGKYVEPTIDGTSAATASYLDALKKDLRTSVVDTSAPDGYPICGCTYVLLSKTPKDLAKSKALVDFLKWVLTEGQDQAKALQYAPLPKEVSALDEAALSGVQTK